MQRFLYDNGLPFQKPLDMNLTKCKGRININKASLVIIDGAIGEGKTTLAVECADFYQGATINMKEQIAMGGIDFQEKCKIAIRNNYKVIIYDESGDFDKRQAISKFNMALNRFFDTYRTYKIFVILCLPYFNVLENYLFEKKIVRGLLHCYGRTETYGCYKGFDLSMMYWLKWHLEKEVVKPMAYGKQKCSFHGNFLNLPSERAKELDEISTSSKRKILDKNIVFQKNLLSLTDMANKLNMSAQGCSKIVQKLGLSPDMKLEGKTYYTQDDYKQIEISHLEGRHSPLKKLEKAVGNTNELD
jgi:hypothetical protein